MKQVAAVAVAFGLVATCAFAAAPAGALRDADKVPVARSMTGGYDKGLLDCSGAIEIDLDTVYAADNTGAPDNVDFYGCASWNNTGGEVVFHLYLAEPTMWVTTMVTSGCDLDLAVLDSCDEDLGCLIVSGGGVVLTNVPVQGDFYFVVDGYNGAACPFTFQVGTQAPPPPPEPEVIGPFCDAVEDVSGTVFTGTTCGGLDNIPIMGCSNYASNGLEYCYEVRVPAAASFTAEVTSTADGALYILDTCHSPSTCLAYADNTVSNQAEVVSFTNETAGDTYVYLVVDSYGTGTCGDYTMTFAATGGAVSVEAATFGTVKSMFR